MKRNNGLDALRMCSMFMVVILHVLAQGGILSALGESPYNVNYQAAWFLETAACCAVNCFALLSGYVGVTTKFYYYRGVLLWLQVVFWTVLLTMLYAVLNPEVVGIRQWINAVFPVSMQQYWYVTAYFCMFLFVPFLNKLLLSLGNRELKLLGITIVCGVVFYPTAVIHDLYTLQGGYSFAWIAFLYVLGGIMKRLEFGSEIKKSRCVLVYICSVLLAWGAKFLLETHSISFISPNFLINYTAPTMLLCAAALLLLFSKWQVKSKIADKFIKTASPLAFSVYIIHTNPLVWSNWLADRYASAAEKSPLLFLLLVLFYAAVIYIVCSMADFVRYQIFKKLKLAEKGKEIEFRITKRN